MLQNVKIHSKYKAKKNIDRIKYFSYESFPDITFLTAAYHLENGKKTGGINFYSLTDKTIKEVGNINYDLDYGILDIKQTSINNKILLYTANSNQSFTIFDISNNSLNNIKIPLHSKILNSSSDTSNIIELFNINDKNNNNFIICNNNGSFNIFDGEIYKEIDYVIGHSAGIWSTCLIDNNVFLTGGEDSKINLWDKRILNKPITTNFSYNSSINCIKKLNLNNNVLITGSYDEKIVLLDLKKFPEEIKKINTEHSSWDMIEVNINGKNLILISSIYEGINIWEIDNELNMCKKLNIPITKNEDLYHRSIVYGVDVLPKKNGIDVLSCSFYDNLIIYWTYEI